MILPYQIIQKVADHEGIPVAMMLKNDRHRRCKDARQKAMYFMRKLTNLNDTSIAQNFEGMNGTKDRCSVIHALKTVNNLLETDKIYLLGMEELFVIFGLHEIPIDQKQLTFLESYNSNAETSMPKLKLQPQKQAKQPVSDKSGGIVSVYYLEALKRPKGSCINSYGEVKVL
jgi:hypothetical protein